MAMVDGCGSTGSRFRASLSVPRSLPVTNSPASFSSRGPNMQQLFLEILEVNEPRLTLPREANPYQANTSLRI